MSIQVATPAAVEASIADLLVVVEREHQLTLQAARSVLTHAIAAGRALEQIRVQIPEGQWKAWVNEHAPIHFTTACDYMRAAHFSDTLEAAGVATLEDAMAFLRGMPRDPSRPGRGGLPAQEKAARQMSDQGASNAEIAEALGVAKSTVYWWLNPEARRRNLKRISQSKKEAARGKKIAERERQAREMKNAGGAVAETYALIRKALQTLDLAIDHERGREMHYALDRAMTLLHAAEDEIVKASKLR